MSETLVICVVDDDPSVRSSLGRLFESVGLGVETFSDAESFLLHEARQPSQVVVLDFAMPGMNGLEVLRVLRQRGSQQPAIFLTAHTDLTLREMASQAGVFAFYDKPFDPDALIQSVHDALRKCQA